MRVILHSKSTIVADIPDFVREMSENTYADADLTAEQAGRLCYLSWHRPNEKTAKNPGYLLNICTQKHYSVLGHSSASFYIDEISRNCSHEIVRHRWFTFSEVSQRYVDAEGFWMAGHPGLKDLKEEEKNRIQHAFIDSKNMYRDIVDDLEGVGYPRKKARQAARSVLPGGTDTKILMSGNLRAWRDFLAQRLALGADDEIRSVALEIYKILKGEFPNSFRDFDSQGLITVERLIDRALHRYDVKDVFFNSPQRTDGGSFVAEVRNILSNGLWVLETDQWKEDES
jgi:thymidylate synthase (FAD)